MSEVTQCDNPDCGAHIGGAGTFVRVSIEANEALQWKAGSAIVDGRPVAQYVEGALDLRVCLECANRHVVPLTGLERLQPRKRRLAAADG